MLNLNFKLCSTEQTQSFICQVEGTDRLSHGQGEGEALFVYDRKGHYLGSVAALSKYPPASVDELEVTGDIGSGLKGKLYEWLLAPFAGIENFCQGELQTYLAGVLSPELKNYQLAFRVSTLLHSLEPDSSELQGRAEDTLGPWLLLRSICWLD